MTKHALVVIAAMLALACSHEQRPPPRAAVGPIVAPPPMAAQSGVRPPVAQPARGAVVARPAEDRGGGNPYVQSPAEGWSEVNRVTPRGDSSDSGITANIRRSIVADERLSLPARNVMIVTRDGNVTLIGRIQDERERQVLGELVTRVPGVRRIEDQLEVRP